MSQLGTIRRCFAVAFLTVAGAWAQVSPFFPATLPAAGLSANISGLNWRRLGRPSLNTNLAGPATGPLAAVWYSPDGGTLFAETSSGRVYQTADFENWSSSDATPPEAAQPVLPARRPEPQADVVAVSGDTRRYWSLGRSLLSSDDGGLTWTNLSGPGEGVIGSGQHDIAVRPGEPASFAVANDEGVWQSADGGQSWLGLNENLPNLPVSRIISTNRGAVRIALSDGRVLQLTDSRSSWSLAASETTLASENHDRQRAKLVLGAEITALGHAGDYAYTGSSDGRIWVSRDRGINWTLTQMAAGPSGRGQVDRIYVDAEAPRSALAVVSGPAPRLFRTVNAGAVWDDVTGNLGDMGIRGAVADRASGTAYAATDHGVFMARVDMNAFTPASAWQPLKGSLPAARAVDVALGASGRELFVALEGYGLYTAPAPVRSGVLRLTNAADFSTRPAAPGSVISVLGGKVTAASAGDLKFPILAAGETESQLQVPFEAVPNTVDLAIEAAHGPVSLPLSIRAVSPAIFVDPDGSPFLVDAESGLTIDAASAARPRAILQFMATGLGRVQPDWQTGVPAPAENPPAVAAAVKAYLDGMPLEVTKATLAPGYIGYYLVEVQLPAVLNSGPAELYITADGQESNKVRVRVESQFSLRTE